MVNSRVKHKSSRNLVYMNRTTLKRHFLCYTRVSHATEVKVIEVEFKPQFVSRMIPKLEWTAFVQAADTLGHLNDLPNEVVPDYEKNEEFLRKVHHALLEVEVLEGCLQCPESGREFPITRGVPNMLLNEDET